jgi:hypothetical protein
MLNRATSGMLRQTISYPATGLNFGALSKKIQTGYSAEAFIRTFFISTVVSG